MSLLRPDPLYPIFDKNRDEIFLLEYEGFIKNVIEGIVLSMLFTKQRWISKYPKLNEFTDILNGEVYDKTLMYTNIIEYLKELSNIKLSDEEISFDISELENIINIIPYQQYTILEYAIQSLLKQKFVKKCIFIKSTPFNKNELQYLASTFEESIKKISIISGPTEEAFEEYQPTTCFTSSINTINKCIVIGGRLLLKDRLFILRNTNENVYYSEEDKIFHYRTEFLSEMDIINKSKVNYIAPMYSFKQEVIERKKIMG